MSKKIRIDWNENEYRRFLAMETKLLSYIEDLRDIATKTIGVDEVEDLQSYLKNPLGYLQNEYWSLYSNLFPPMANKELTFKNNSIVSISRINELSALFTNLNVQMRHHKPTITKTSVVSGLDKEFFNIYLDSNKKAHYNALKSFLDSAKELNKYAEVNGLNIIRSTQNLLLDGISPKINTTHFAE